MASKKYNEYLDAGESQEDESEYDSETALDSKVARASKKRKRTGQPHNRFQDGSESESSDNGDEAAEQEDPLPAPTKRRKPSSTQDGESKQNGDQYEDATPIADLKHKKAKLKAPKKNKTGVIYLSRVPPFMKPAAVRNLLSPYGEISRIFLTPEAPTSHSARVRNGGNKKRSFVDGWVEFVHKSDAKLVAETLNANIIGGKKGGYYHDDVWNIRYLRGFKWADLTEQIKNENAERAARLRLEIAQTTKENKRFVEGFEKAKMLEKMEGKRREREAKGGLPPRHGVSNSTRSKPQERVPSKAQSSRKRDQPEQEQSQDVQKVLDLIM